MFEIGWSELLIIAVVAIVIVGPRELPKLLRTFGAAMSRMRRMAGEFQDQFREAMREAEIEEARREMEKLRDANPLNEIRDEMQSIADQARFDPNQPTSTSTSATTTSASPQTAADAPPPSALAPSAPTDAAPPPSFEPAPQDSSPANAPAAPATAPSAPSTDAPREPERSSAAGSA